MTKTVALLPRIPTPEMVAAAWECIEASKQATGIAKLGPGLGTREIWQAMFDAAPATRVEQPELVERVAKAIRDKWWELADSDGYVLNRDTLIVAEAAIEATQTDQQLREEVERLQRENADLKQSVIAFAGPWAGEWAEMHELPKGHLHPHHYDLLERCGARMVDFTRSSLSSSSLTK